jgi:hypothetical protein
LVLYSILVTLSEEQITALAPDASSLKAGRDLAVAAKWQLKGGSDRALWGHCQGSGKLPYQTQIDLQNLAFKCSCPSRKFPCKHGLGLLLLYLNQSAAFSKEVEPDWVTGWLDKRLEKTEKKAEQKDKPVDAEAQAKRIQARAKKVADGVDDLQFWIKDLLHTGLMAVPERSMEFWQTPAKRMIDAQATGLAGMVKSLGNINYYTDGWKYDLLDRLTRMYTLTEAFKRAHDLSEEFATEIKTLIGVNQSREELLAQQGIQDHWIILSRTYADEEQLTVERNWLYGVNTGKFALVLQFFAAVQLPELNLIPGTSINALLVFYKGVKVFRALIKQQNSTGSLFPVKGQTSLSAAFENFSSLVSANPFIERAPVIVNKLRLIKGNPVSYFYDLDGRAVPLNCTAEVEIKMLAVTGGALCTAFMLLNETDAWPLAIWFNDKFYSFGNAIQK